MALSFQDKEDEFYTSYYLNESRYESEPLNVIPINELDVNKLSLTKTPYGYKINYDDSKDYIGLIFSLPPMKFNIIMDTNNRNNRNRNNKLLSNLNMNDVKILKDLHSYMADIVTDNIKH